MPPDVIDRPSNCKISGPQVLDCSPSWLRERNNDMHQMQCRDGQLGMEVTRSWSYMDPAFSVAPRPYKFTYTQKSYMQTGSYRTRAHAWLTHFKVSMAFLRQRCLFWLVILMAPWRKQPKKTSMSTVELMLSFANEAVYSCPWTARSYSTHLGNISPKLWISLIFMWRR